MAFGVELAVAEPVAFSWPFRLLHKKSGELAPGPHVVGQPPISGHGTSATAHKTEPRPLGIT